ncbi:hypothetical protein [Leminorella grimontii]|uniref:hypothetical protein n=1 Tax=Leminorella grimontii TaxID=82981 RepID=UPI00106D9E1B|nr:hypothetical protein [Leminorella grimontii]
MVALPKLLATLTPWAVSPLVDMVELVMATASPSVPAETCIAVTLSPIVLTDVPTPVETDALPPSDHETRPKPVVPEPLVTLSVTVSVPPLYLISEFPSPRDIASIP